MTEELWRMGAAELTALIRSREVSSVEAVQADLERIDVVNPALNAVVASFAEHSLDEARRADQRTVAGEIDLASFHGVPVTIKENIDIAGTATTHGVPAFADAIA